MTDTNQSENEEQALQDKQIIAQGSIEYNGQVIAYIVYKSGNGYLLDVSFIRGSKQGENDKKVEFEFKQESEGKFYLSSKKLLFHKVFIEEKDGEKSMTLLRGNEEIMKLAISQDGVTFTSKGEKVKNSSITTLNGNRVNVNVDSFACILSNSAFKKVAEVTSKFFGLVERASVGEIRV